MCVHVHISMHTSTHQNWYKHMQGKQETPHKRIAAFMCVNVIHLLHMYTSTHHYWHTNTGKEKFLTSGSMHLCVYMYKYVCIYLRTNTDTKTQAKTARDSSRVARCIHVCTCTYIYYIYVYIYTPSLTHKHSQGEQETPHQRIDPFMRVHVHTFIAYMYTSTHHYWHNNTGTERPLTSGLMQICMHTSTHQYWHKNTGKDSDPSRGESWIYVCICIRIYSHT